MTAEYIQLAEWRKKYKVDPSRALRMYHGGKLISRYEPTNKRGLAGRYTSVGRLILDIPLEQHERLKGES